MWSITRAIRYELHCNTPPLCERHRPGANWMKINCVNLGTFIWKSHTIYVQPVAYLRNWFYDARCIWVSRLNTSTVLLQFARNNKIVSCKSSSTSRFQFAENIQQNLRLDYFLRRSCAVDWITHACIARCPLFSFAPISIRQVVIWRNADLWIVSVFHLCRHTRSISKFGAFSSLSTNCMILILTCCALSSIMIKSIELRLIGADAKPQASFELFERIFVSVQLHFASSNFLRMMSLFRRAFDPIEWAHTAQFRSVCVAWTCARKTAYNCL